MGVSWSESQRERVQLLIGQYPLAGTDCTALGRSLLPIAREVDQDSHGVVVRPNTRLVRLIKPRHDDVKWWFYHVTVMVERHGVDALAGTCQHV